MIKHGEEIALSSLSWEASVGTITEKGQLTIADLEGTCKITARSADVSGFAMRHDRNKGKDSATSTYAEETISMVGGDYTRNKWTVFYTKVLARFAGSSKLRISVSFDIDDESVVTDQKIEEATTALKELGL